MIHSSSCAQVFSVKNAEVVGEVSVKGDSFLLCSFYGEFIDSISGTTVGIPPVQCYKDESSPVSSEFVYTTPATVNILYTVKTLNNDPPEKKHTSKYDIKINMDLHKNAICFISFKDYLPTLMRDTSDNKGQLSLSSRCPFFSRKLTFT